MLGIVFPLCLILIVAMPRLKGDKVNTWIANSGDVITPLQAFGFGLHILGMALCIHAFFYQRYDNHREIKCTIIAAGVVSFIFGLYLRYGGTV